MTPIAALFVGDVSWDLTLHIDHVPLPDEKVHAENASESAGGVIANAAVAAALAGASTKALIKCGDDLIGREIVARMAARGIEVSASVAPGLTCRVVILLEPHGEKRLLLHPGVSMYPTSDQTETALLDGVGWVHTAIYDSGAAIALVNRCRKRGIRWSIDLEPATFVNDVAELASQLAGATVVFCNTRAAAKLGPDPVSRLQSLGAKAVILTQGQAGAAWCAGTAHTIIAAPRLPVVDTTGAGDCLAGWFIAETLRGADPVAALNVAVAAATVSCGATGAQSSFPIREAIGQAIAQAAVPGRFNGDGVKENTHERASGSASQGQCPC